MKDTIGFAVVGCGVISPWHGDSISALPEARLVACCDIVEEAARKFSEKYGGIRYYLDHHKLLEDPEVDAICVCTPSGSHAAIAIDAARAGKHVMVEKPADITLENIDAMIRTCREQRVKLGVIFQRRTAPIFRQIRQLIAEGRLGRMVLGDAYLKYYRSPEYYRSAGWRGTWQWDGGGALMNQGVHCIDLLQWIMGPVESIYGQADHLAREIEVEDTSAAVLKFRSGAFGVIEGTTSVKPGMSHRLEFHGAEGTIRTNGDKIAEWSFPGSDEVKPAEGEQADGAASDPTAIGRAGHQTQIADLIAAIKEDRDPMVTGEEGRKAVEIILAIYQSARSGQPVKL